MSVNYPLSILYGCASLLLSLKFISIGTFIEFLLRTLQKHRSKNAVVLDRATFTDCESKYPFYDRSDTLTTKTQT